MNKYIMRLLGIESPEYWQMLEEEKQSKMAQNMPLPPKAKVEALPQPQGIPTPQELVALVQAHHAKVAEALAVRDDLALEAAEAARQSAQTALCYVFEEHLIAALPEIMVVAGRKDNTEWPGCWVVIGKLTETPEMLTALQEVGLVPGQFDHVQAKFLLRLSKALADKGWRLQEHTLDLDVDLAIQLVLEPFPLDALQALPTVAA